MTAASIGLILKKSALLLQDRLPEDPRISMTVPRTLLAFHLRVDPSYLMAHPHQRVDGSIVRLYDQDLELYIKGTPLSRIWGQREFWSLPFTLSQATLDPRPETEHVVEVALDRFRLSSSLQSSPFLVDLGTGSGCLLISLLKEIKTAQGIGLDLSQEALLTAQSNAQSLGVGQRTFWIQGDWARALTGQFSMIVSNPPYLSTQDMTELGPTVSQFDPHLALYGGPDGLECYRDIFSDAHRILRPSGLCVVEIGHTQATEVVCLFTHHGFQAIQVHQDLASKDRVVSGIKA